MAGQLILHDMKLPVVKTITNSRCNMKTLMILALALSLTGTAHAGWFLEDYSDVNDKISQYNESNKTNAANALVACGSDAACKVGVMAIFFSNNGIVSWRNGSF